MEIQVGEYIRTEDGIIDKIIDIYTPDKYEVYENKYILQKHYYVTEKGIKKHSKNIIDLIEVGDYVNGYYCLEVDDEMCNFDLNTKEWTPLKYIDIWDNILTHEQYKRECYKVVE